jgi:L-malate glycosyltransferase
VFSLHIDTARAWRGGQNQVLLTVMGLVEQRQRAMLVAHPDGELRRRAAEGLDLVPLAPRHELDLRAAWRLSRVLKASRPDVVHAHDPHAVSMGAVGISMAGLDPAPVLVASRRVDFHLKKHSFSRWKYGTVALFVTASHAIAGVLRADGIAAGRIVTVHEGIDADRIARVPPASLHGALWLPAHAPVVLNIGALVPHKGQRHLVDAAARVVRDVPDARFVILGEGELRGALEQQVKHLGLERHVFLPGFRQDVIALLKSADLFVMSSEMEGLGTSILDAMACEKAVVGTRAGGIPEIVEHEVTGLLVAPHDGAAMADAITRLLTDPATRARMATAGLARVREHFTVERMVRETRAAYERALGSRAPT